ncbi:hypothetical protein [Rhizobium sp. NPDC090279]|uniref:hypothetical protein n=1 Tax=Rhizobium sp. NPDC090279 TaxID=3364499 RepID=UPI00383AAB36
MTSQFDMFSGNAQTPSRSKNARARLQESAEAVPNEAEMVRLLEATGRYQILRKLKPRRVVAIARQAYPLRGVILDTETIGVHLRHKFTQLCISSAPA